MLPPLSPLSGFPQPALKNQSDIVQKTGKAHWCRAGKTHLLSKNSNVQKEARVGRKCWPEQRAGWSSSISEPMSQWLMTWKYSCWCLYVKSRQLFLQGILLFIFINVDLKKSFFFFSFFFNSAQILLRCAAPTAIIRRYCWMNLSTVVPPWEYTTLNFLC